MMKYTLKGWLVDNAITTENKEDKILVLESSGNKSLKDILAVMKEEDTGLRSETIEHVVNLYHRVLSRLAMSGYNINTGLFQMVPQFRGVVDNGQWNPAKNSIYISLNQGKELREAIAQTAVSILGEKKDFIFIFGSEDTATRATDGTATAGRTYKLNGRMLKVAGTDPAVGITLTDSSGAVTRLTEDMLVVNNPTQLIILLPSGLADGEYTLTVTTQYSGGGAPLKVPRSVNRLLTIGSGGGSDPGEGEDPSV